MRKYRDNSEAFAAFMTKKAEIDILLERLAVLSTEHFNTDPETIHWGHVGTLEFYATQLRHITDAAFKEGEHAE